MFLTRMNNYYMIKYSIYIYTKIYAKNFFNILDRKNSSQEVLHRLLIDDHCKTESAGYIPRALHTYNNTQVPNDNTHDAPNEGRAILRHGEAGFR